MATINPVLDAYFHDQTIPADKKANLAKDLDSNKIDPQTAAGIISNKYPQLKNISSASPTAAAIPPAADTSNTPPATPAKPTVDASAGMASLLGGSPDVTKQALQSPEGVNPTAPVPNPDIPKEQTPTSGYVSPGSQNTTPPTDPLGSAIKAGLDTTVAPIVGAGKGALSTVDSLNQLGKNLLPGPTPSQADQMKNDNNGQMPAEPDHLIPENFRKPTDNFGEQLGFSAEKVAEFLAPMGEMAKAGKLTDSVIESANIPNWIKGGLKLLAKSGIEGAGTGAVSLAQQGKVNDEVKTNTAIGAAFPFVGAGLGVLGGVAGSVATHFASALSGTPAAAIEQAFKNPEAVQNAIKNAVQDGGDATAQRILAQTHDALGALKSERSNAYQEGLKSLEDDLMTTKNGKLYVKNAEGIFEPTKLTTQGVKSTLTQTLKDFGGKVANGAIDASEMAIDKSHVNKLQEIMDRIYAWKDTTPTKLNKLRQIIGSYEINGVSPSSSEKQFDAIVGKLKDNLSSYVTDRIPQVGELNKKYASQSTVIDNVINQLKTNSKDPNTALRKLVNVFNPKSAVYRPIVKELGDKAGIDLMSDIAGLTMSKWTPEGIGKYLTTGLGSVEASAILSNPAMVATLPATLAASSPRVVGSVATNLGKIAENVKIPPVAIKAAKAAIMKK